MTPDLHVVVTRELDDGVGRGKIEDSRARLDRLPLHLVLGSELVELAGDRLCIRGVLESRRAHGHADRPLALAKAPRRTRLGCAAAPRRIFAALEYQELT